MINTDKTTDIELLKLYTESGIDETYGDTPHNFFELKNNFLNALSGISTTTTKSVYPNSANTSFTPGANLSIIKAIDEAQKLSLSAPTLSDLREKIKSFTLNPLSKFATNTITGIGVENPKLLVITDTPNSDEDRSGIPLSGATGELLTKILSAMECSIQTNTYTFPISFLRPAGGRTPTHEELSISAPFAKRFIEFLKPHLILLMGSIPVQVLLNKTDPITAICGQIFDYNGIPTMPTFALSFLLNNKEAKRKIWGDIQNIILPKLKEI